MKGLRGVNISWDSGRFSISDDRYVDQSWTLLNGYTVSPKIDDDLIARWPESGEGFDEWYFFREAPPNMDLGAYCNWNAPIADWQERSFRSSLSVQLATYKPELVIGEGWGIYVITRDVETINDFLTLV